MAEYNYQGVDRTGKKVSGKLDAQNEGDLRMALRAQGVRPTSISKSGSIGIKALGPVVKGKGTRISITALVVFTRQLQVLIGSGIPLVQGLEILTEQAATAVFKGVISNIKDKVSQGSYLWEALSQYPLVFPKLYIALIRAGEASGSIDQMLKRLSKYLEDSDRIRKLVKGAMMYPAIVILIGCAVVGVMLTFVIPKFEELIKSNGQELPLPTQIVVNMSHFMIHNVAYVLGGAVIGGYLTFQYFSTPEGRVLRDRILFNAPLFGNIVQKSAVARFSRTLQTLLNSGVNLIDAIDICKATIDNAVLEEAVGKIRKEVEAGKTLGTVIASLNIFPKMAVQMISVGESTGNLDKMLEKVADFFETETEALVGGLTKLIEPFVLVFLGGTIGGMMIAMYLPIFKMGDAVK